MKFPVFTVALLAVGALSSTTHAQDNPPESPQDQKPKRPNIPRYGANIGFEQHLSTRTRDTFGNRGISFSPGLGPSFARRGLLILPDFNFFSAEKEIGGLKNRAFYALVGPSFRYGFVEPFTVEETEDGKRSIRFRTFAPYVQFSVGLGYTDVKVSTADREEKGFAYGASFAIGTSISKNAYLETRLRLMPKIASYDFSAIGIELGLRF